VEATCFERSEKEPSAFISTTFVSLCITHLLPSSLLALAVVVAVAAAIVVVVVVITVFVTAVAVDSAALVVDIRPLPVSVSSAI
jgi:hypothetical protein